MKDNNVIERIIDEIGDYIDSCRFKTFSQTEIIVDKNKMETMLGELRRKIPQELEKSRKIVANQQEIINAATAKADKIKEEAKINAKTLLDQVSIKTSELVSEHEIMLEAYRMGDEVVDTAVRNAQEIMDDATIQSNELKEQILDYVDDMLFKLESLIGGYMEQSAARYNSFYGSLEECLGIVKSNREEIAPPDPVIEQQVQQIMQGAENDTPDSTSGSTRSDTMDLGVIDISDKE